MGCNLVDSIHFLIIDSGIIDSGTSRDKQNDLDTRTLNS